MRTARNYFIVSLAVSDLVLCSVTMPLTLWDILRSVAVGGSLLGLGIGGFHHTIGAPVGGETVSPVIHWCFTGIFTNFVSKFQ